MVTPCGVGWGTNVDGEVETVQGAGKGQAGKSIAAAYHIELAPLRPIQHFASVYPLGVCLTNRQSP